MKKNARPSRSLLRSGFDLPVDARVDLHLHSSLSDGTFSPAQLVRLARAEGMHVISLTDHDTVAGIDEALCESRSAGMLLVPGVELSVGYGRGEIHILGYGIDPKSHALRDSLNRLAAEREVRMEKMVKRLRQRGMPAELDGVRELAGGDILGRLHLATYMHRKGFVESLEDAFERFIGNGRPAFVRRRHLTLKSAVDLIVGAGGIPVLAHPGLTRRDDLIEYLIRLGIRGLEVNYPWHTQGDTARYWKICRRHDLLVTGGSDFHGSGKPGISIGKALTPREEFEKMLDFLNI